MARTPETGSAPSALAPLPAAAMEARLVAALPDGPGWQFEPKWDGFRALIGRDGDQLRHRGGMPVLNGRGRGDLIIEIAVETPTRLTARQRELLEEFRTSETGEESPQAAGFFAKLRGMFVG